MIGTSYRRVFTRGSLQKTLVAAPKRNISIHSLKYVQTTIESNESDVHGDNFKLRIPVVNKRIQVSISADDTLETLENKIWEADSSISNIDFNTIDGGPGSSFLMKSENIGSLVHYPFLLTLNDTDAYVINLSQNSSPMGHSSREDIFDPNEESFFAYCKSIGIPNKNSEVLASFLDKTYAGISPEISNTNDIKASIFDALSSFRELPRNKWGTTKVPDLKKILDEKEKELFDLNSQKEALDKKALARANLMLYLGGTTLIAQFGFIVSGTYLYFCWDVMEPIAYLMMTANLTCGFGYYWWTHSELDFEPLQGRFKGTIARRIYRKNKFDYDHFKQLKQDVLKLRELINNLV